METKPFSIQSPEQIAKDYGGNKQKIAEAMQMGVLDATAGTLAGMFIDRIRNAAQAEAAPQQSVAQQVFAPPMPIAPGAGLAGTPQAAAMQAPPMAPPGAPPPAGLAAAPMPAPGMAAGGLTTLPLPDGMFDEPDYGGYRGGGLVAFAAGSPGELVEADPETGVAVLEDPDENILVSANREDALDDQYGYRPELRDNLDLMRTIAPTQTRQRDRMTQFIEQQLNPEAQRARRQEDMWMALGQIGARMATTPGSLLQAIGTGVGEALPGIREAAATRRAEERADLASLAEQEGLSNREAREYAQLAMTATNQYGQIDMARLNREQAERFKKLDLSMERWRTLQQVGAQMYASNRSYQGQVESASIGDRREQRQLITAASSLAEEMQAADPVLRQLRLTDSDAADARADAITATAYSRYGLPAPTGVSGVGAPPPGTVRLVRP